MLARHSVSRLLETRGFKVESVSSGQEALDRLENYRPSLIVTDMKSQPANCGYPHYHRGRSPERHGC